MNFKNESKSQLASILRPSSFKPYTIHLEIEPVWRNFEKIFVRNNEVMAHDDNLSGCEDQLANGDSVLDQPPVLTDRICSFCRKKCMRLNPYERHISHCKFRLQCKICLITFRNEDWLKIHLNDHLGNFKENLFECFDCKCRYKSMVDLWQHLRHH